MHSSRATSNDSNGGQTMIADDNKITKSKALYSLHPNSSWVLRGDTLEWNDKETKAPSDDEIEKERLRLQAEYDANEYQRDRQYPELGEQLDMLFHDMTAGKGTKDGEWYKAVAKVKADNPKPTE